MTPRKNTPSTAKAQAVDATTKFRWLNALNGARNISPRALKLALAIANHVNGKSGEAFVGTDALADETGMPTRAVERAREELRRAGWLRWRRTGSANVYRPLLDQLERVENLLADLKIERNDRRREARETKIDPSPVSERKRVRPDVGVGTEPTRVTGIPVSEPVKLNCASKKEVVVVDRGTPPRPRGRPRRYGPPPWTVEGISKATFYRRRVEDRARELAEAHVAGRPPDVELAERTVSPDVAVGIPHDHGRDRDFDDDEDAWKFRVFGTDAPSLATPVAAIRART